MDLVPPNHVAYIDLEMLSVESRKSGLATAWPSTLKPDASGSNGAPQSRTTTCRLCTI
jgi:hypothetical protein